MKRKAKILALFGLGSVIALGLVYWLFPSSFPFGDRRPKTEIFAGAFARGEFERCYFMMADDYRTQTPQAEFVAHWEEWFTSHHLQLLGRYQEIVRLASPTPNEIGYEISYRGAPGWKQRWNEVIEVNVVTVLHLATRDGHSIISDVSIDKGETSIYAIVVTTTPTPIPTPTPDQDPIS